MAILGGVTHGPTDDVMLTLLLTSMLLGTQTNAASLPSPSPVAAETTTKTNRPAFPYRFWHDGKGSSVPTSTTLTTSEASSYAYYYKKDEDLGTDPSTWKLLPIQIPDDLVSGASIQEEVTMPSMVPPYPSLITPQYGRHPGATQPLSSYPSEEFHQGSDQGNPKPQQLPWKSPESEGSKPHTQDKRVSHGRPEPQDLTWERYEAEEGHTSQEPQREDWEDHEVSHTRPEIQREDWEHPEVSHDRPEPQQENWEHHGEETHDRPESQRDDWEHPEVSHDRPEPQQENWEHHGEATHDRPESQRDDWEHPEVRHDRRENWEHHDQVSHGRPEPQREDWEQHEVSQVRPQPQRENWNHHNTMSHGRPKPQQEPGDHHVTAGSHITHEPQQQTWGGTHSIDYSTESHEPQHPDWDVHHTESGHRNSGPQEPQHQNWDRRDPEANAWALEPEHSHRFGAQEQHHWGHDSMKHGTQHASLPSQHYYNWTHTIDGYEIRNHYENDPFTHESHVTDMNSDQPQHVMPTRPMAWNWKPPDAPAWHQNIVERLGQHLPKLPALSKLRLPGLGSLPRLPSLPQWISGGHNRRVHDHVAEEVEGDYVHKFYHLVPENNPLEHLESNLDRHHRPHYKYPPRQENTLSFDHGTEEAPQHQGHSASPDSGDGAFYTPQRPARPHHHGPQIHSHHNTRNEPQMSHQEPQYSTQHTRRPSHNHPSPQRILKVPHRQAYEGYLEKHHGQPDREKWMWEDQQEHTTPSQPAQRDPLNRYPSPLHNWLPQEPTRPSSGYVSRNNTRHPHHYRPQTHTAPPQRPYSPQPGHGHPYHQQQQQEQGSGSSWLSAVQNYQGPEDYDNILDPLSSLLSRPSPFPIIGSSPYQQSILERITGVSTSSTAGLSIPGGLLVLGLALALFYFNFVWYPTPVVTAKIFKMLNDNTPAGSLSTGQQRAIGEVYQVFRSLEKEYKHDPSASSAPCRSRLVCQVHEELPGLWSVTQAYAALVKSSLASGSEGDIGFSGYEAAARRGSQGGDCAALYKECALPAAPVKATLRKLLNLLLAA